MPKSRTIRVAVNGYGVIGKRVAAAVALQEDMSLAGVSDVVTDWRARMATRNGFRLFGATGEHASGMRAVGLEIAGTLDDLLGQSDVVVDCTPKHVAAKNIDVYRRGGLKFILQGGEKREATGHSFVAESNFASAINREATRVVSCNTTSIVRTLTVLKRAGLLQRARGTLLRRATDPWESHESGIMNTLVPEPEIPSHQGPDAQSVDPDLDVVTMAVKVPETLFVRRHGCCARQDSSSLTITLIEREIMIRKHLTALIVGLALVLPVGASAHESHGKKVIGTVTMAAADHVMVKTADGKEQTIAVNTQTKVVKGNTPVKGDGLKPGTRVVITLTPKEPPTAAQIQIGTETAAGQRKK